MGEWRTWNPEHPFEIVDPLGEPMRIYQEASEPDEHGVVVLKAKFEAVYWDQPLVAPAVCASSALKPWTATSR